MSATIAKLSRLLEAKGIRKWKVITPLDRVLLGVGIIDRPLLYQSSRVEFALVSGFMFFGIPFFGWLLNAVLARSLWPFRSVNEIAWPELLAIHAALSMFCGIIAMRNSRENMRKLNLPPWDELESVEQRL